MNAEQLKKFIDDKFNSKNIYNDRYTIPHLTKEEANEALKSITDVIEKNPFLRDNATVETHLGDDSYCLFGTIPTNDTAELKRRGGLSFLEIFAGFVVALVAYAIFTMNPL